MKKVYLFLVVSKKILIFAKSSEREGRRYKARKLRDRNMKAH